MSPVISVTQGTFERIQRHAAPLIDTPETVLNRLMDIAEGKISGRSNSPGDILRFNATALPNLTHTTVTSARWNGKEIDAPSWKTVLNLAIENAAKSKVALDEIRRISGVKIFDGKKEDQGYAYLRSVNLSVQGQDAVSASRGIVRVAQHLKVSFEATFYWQEKEGAEFPGRSAVIELP